MSPEEWERLIRLWEANGFTVERGPGWVSRSNKPERKGKPDARQ